MIDGVAVNLTIRDVRIDRNKSEEDKLESPDDAAITLRNGATLNLTLVGENYLEGSTGAAISAPMVWYWIHRHQA